MQKRLRRRSGTCEGDVRFGEVAIAAPLVPVVSGPATRAVAGGRRESEDGSVAAGSRCARRGPDFFLARIWRRR